MKSLILSIFVIASLTIGHNSYGYGNNHFKFFENPQGGDYWPWGKEVEFPWDSIQGVWVAKSFVGLSTYFSFQVAKNNGRNILKITQYARFTCDLIAQGVGYEAQRVVKAKLKGPQHKSNIQIHFFKRSDVIGSDDTDDQLDNSDDIMAVVMVKSSENSRSPTFFDITKISSDPKDFCQ